MDTADDTGMTMRGYLGMARRHFLLILAIPVIAAVGAYFYSASQTPMYEASAQLLYQQAIDPMNPMSYADPITQELQVQSATAVIAGPRLAAIVASTEDLPEATSYSMSVTATNPEQSGSGSSYSNGVRIQVSSPDPEVAARLANAYATQFINWRAETQRAALTEAASALRDQLASYTTPGLKESSEYLLLKQRLQSIEVRAATATGDFTVVIPATVPTVPYAPNPERSAVLACAVGLFVGIGAAFAREKLDSRIRDYQEVGGILGLPVVGRIPLVDKTTLESGPLAMVNDQHGRAADALRILQTNLEFASMGSQQHTLMVTSALAGEGKSLWNANLASSMSLTGKRVLLVDADLRRPQMHRLFDLPNVNGISTVMAGKALLEDAIQDVGAVTYSTVAGPAGVQAAESTLSVLTAGPQPPNPGVMVASQRFAEMMEHLKSLPFDAILVDAPAFLAVGDASAMAPSVDGLVPLVNMRVASRPVLQEFKDRLGRLPVPKLGVIVVGEKPGASRRYDYYGSDSTSDSEAAPSVAVTLRPLAQSGRSAERGPTSSSDGLGPRGRRA